MPELKVRGEIHTKVKETEDQGVMEKKKERERARAEVDDDLKFNSTMGMKEYSNNNPK